MLTCRFRLYSS